MAALREVIAKFVVDFDKKKLDEGEKAVDGLAGKLANFATAIVGGLAVGALAHFVTGLADTADHLKDQAAVLGVSTGELQQWQYAAKLSGVEAEEFNGALLKFNKNVAEAGAGTGPAADAFRKLGVQVKDGAGKLAEPIDLLDGVAAGLAKIQNPAERTQVLMSLLGRGGAKLGPLFEEGAEGLAKFKQEFEDLGGGLSDDFIDKSAEMNDAIDRMNFGWVSFKSRLAGLVIPTVTRFLTLATKVVGGITKWVDKTGILTEKTNLAAGAAAVLGAVFLRAGIKAIAPWLPMIALFAGLILLADELFTFWEGGDTLIGRGLDAAFGPGTQDKVRKWLHEVTDSVKAFFKDTEKGWNDFGTALELIWFDLTTWLSSGWKTFTAGVELMVFDMGAGIGHVVDDIGDAFAEMWDGILKGAQATLDALPGGAKKAADIAQLLADRQRDRAAAHAADGRLEAGARASILGKADIDQAAIDAQRLAIVRAGDDRIAPRAAPVMSVDQLPNAPVNITINVPPGTSPQQTRAVGEAAKAGVQQGQKAKQNALVKTAG